mgnify:CR=1 FL=1
MLRGLDPIPVENPIWPGRADINYVEGWSELKQLPSWPARDGVVRIDHFTNEQRYFLRERWESGGRAYLLLQVRREWLLFDGPTAAEVVGRVNRAALVDAAIKHWPEGVDEKELVACITS